MISYSTSVIFLTILHYLQNTCEANDTIADVNLWDSSVRFAEEGESEWFKLAAIGIRDLLHDWHASQPVCSGVLITKKHVITSAHCIEQIGYLEDIRVRMGAVELTLAQQNYIKTWTTYKLWAEENGIETGPYEHDISIIELADKAVRSIIPGVITKRPNEFFYNKSVDSLFWGIKYGYPGYAKIGSLKVISNDECTQLLDKTSILRGKIILDPSILCTKFNRGVILEDVDSGSPLLYEKNEVIAISDPTYLQRKGIYTAADIDFHVGLRYYKEFIKNVTKTEKAKWWKVWRRN